MQGYNNSNEDIEILYYFKEIGILIYGEYMLQEYKNNNNFFDAFLSKYDSFLNKNNNNYSKINHRVCFLYFKKQNNKKDKNCDKKVKYILSTLGNNLKINYYNFILLCNLIHYYNIYFNYINKAEISFLLLLLKKFFRKLIINNEKVIENKENNSIIVSLFFYYYSLLLFRLFIKVPDNNLIQSHSDTFYDTFYVYVENIIQNLYKCENDEYINNNLDKLSNYEDYKNPKLNIYISFLKFFLTIIKKTNNDNDDDNEYKDKEYFLNFYEDCSLNKEIKLELLSRKLLFIILNYNEKNFEKQLIKIENILKKIIGNNNYILQCNDNLNINNENNNVNNNNETNNNETINNKEINNENSEINYNENNNNENNNTENYNEKNNNNENDENNNNGINNNENNNEINNNEIINNKNENINHKQNNNDNQNNEDILNENIISENNNIEINNENNILNNENNIKNNNANIIANNNNENSIENNNENIISENINKNFNQNMNNENIINHINNNGNNNINRNINNNNKKNEIFKINYIIETINSNKNLLDNEFGDYNRKDNNVNIEKLIKQLNNIKGEENILINEIILKHNKIVNLSNELILSEEKDKIEKRNEIIYLCNNFLNYLKNLDILKKKYIKENNYLKILITRVLYNYMELLFIYSKRNKNNNENYRGRYEEFTKIIEEFEINNNLINKIHADYYFVADNKKSAEEYYNKYINNNSYNSLAGIFGHASCLYIINNKEYSSKAINQLKNAINKIKELIKIKSYQGILPKLESLLDLFEK